MRNVKLGLIILGGLAALAALIWALLPQPALVEMVPVRRGVMEVTVAAEGVTRVRDPWTVTAPMAGSLMRSRLQVGDPVLRGKTVVAAIRPAEPSLLDARTRAQAEAAVVEAEAAVRLAEVNLTGAEADQAYADDRLMHNRDLAAKGAIPQRALEESEHLAVEADRNLQAARLEVDLRRATLSRIQAQLSLPEAPPPADQPACCLQIFAPLDGTVLNITDIDARLVQAGEPLVTVGDLNEMQIETDLLSTDAVRTHSGALAHVERWGAAEPLLAHVTRIDPVGFTKVSALGIEEQRVRVLLDIDSPLKDRGGLGDHYRVFVRIVIWSGEAVLQVPQGALFRHGDGWAVFRAIDDRAVLTPVEIGHSQDQTVEILGGLQEGEVIIAYPGAPITDGAKVAPLKTN